VELGQFGAEKSTPPSHPLFLTMVTDGGVHKELSIRAPGANGTDCVLSQYQSHVSGVRRMLQCDRYLLG